jgi:hypothetical protein
MKLSIDKYLRAIGQECSRASFTGTYTAYISPKREIVNSQRKGGSIKFNAAASDQGDVRGSTEGHLRFNRVSRDISS